MFQLLGFKSREIAFVHLQLINSLFIFSRFLCFFTEPLLLSLLKRQLRLVWSFGKILGFECTLLKLFIFMSHEHLLLLLFHQFGVPVEF